MAKKIWYILLTGVVVKPLSTHIAKKIWSILLDLYEFFQISRSGDFFLIKNDTLKTKSERKSKKIGYMFFKFQLDWGLIS